MMAKWSDFETHPIGTGKRIEELEAKLAKALECIPPLIVIALDNLDYMNVETRDECEREIEKARATLATLKGQDDE